MSVSTRLGMWKERVTTTTKKKTQRATTQTMHDEKKSMDKDDHDDDHDVDHDVDHDEVFASPTKLRPKFTTHSSSPHSNAAFKSSGRQVPVLVPVAGQGPRYFSRPWDKRHMKRWWPAHAAWSTFFLVLLVAASLVLARHIREGTGDLQRFFDTYSMSDRAVRRFLASPHSVTGIEMHGATYEGPALLRAVPWHVSVDAFDLSILDGQSGQEVAVAMYPAHSSSDANVTARIRFREEYVHLKRLVMRATLQRRLEVFVRANMTYRAGGKSRSAVLARNVTLDARHLEYFGTSKGVGGSGRKGGKHDSDAVSEASTPLGTTMTQLQHMMKEKHKSMLKVESVVPTDAGFDAQMRVDLRVTRVRADLGDMRVGVWLGRHKLLTIDTEASLFPLVDHFKSRVTLNGGWNQTIGNSTVAELLHSVSRKKGRRARVPITIIGEHASEAMWLNVVARSIRTTHRVPAQFVETVLMTAGMPVLVPSPEAAGQPSTVTNATTRSTMPSSIDLNLDMDEE